MESGIVGRWLRNDGDYIREGEPLVEVETEKATTELVAERAGFLTILAADGDSVATGGVLGQIGAEVAETAPDRGQSAGKAETRRDSHAAPPTAVGDPVAGVAAPRRTRATPVARKLAALAGIDLAGLGPGSGPEGRIHRVDVEHLLGARAAGALPTGSARPDQIVEPTRIQSIVARRMTESKQQVPHYYLTTMADMTEAIALKRAAAERDAGVELSITDIVLLACARSLAAHPSVNAAWVDDRIVRRGAVNVGVAVAIGEGELVVPVIRNADGMTLLELAQTRRDLTRRAQERKLGPSDLEGGTFTISNLGLYGVVEFHAIINPPESGILALGQVREDVVVHNGQVSIRPRMVLSLSADHRVYSGVTAAEFADSLRRFVEHPSLALLDRLP